MMLMSEYDDAYVDAMLMVNMQANTRSVTYSVSRLTHITFHDGAYSLLLGLEQIIDGTVMLSAMFLTL